MKKGLIFLLLCFTQLLNSQPVKQWTKLFGGNLTDVGNAVAAYNDTMLIAVGRSSSTNVGGNKGGDDYAICQFKPNGDLIRLKTFGGPQTDQANAMVTLPNGNLIVGGFTNGRGSDVTSLYGLTDIWLLGYDPRTGSKVWQKNYGGTNNDQCNDLFFLEAGKVFLAGHTKSLDRDVVNSPTKGGNDVLITSVDESGNIVKVFTFGGTDDETAKRILKAEDFGGQMLVFGESESNDLDFAGLSRGKKDIFILKINRNINKVFLKTIGGPGDDIFADAIYLGADGMIVFSTVNTPGGQVDSLKGGRDIWMSRLDKDANLLWSRLIGGRLDETAVKAILTPANEILLIANSNSKDQDIAANYGGSDALVMKLDTAGNILWQQNYGGTSGDNSGAICLDASGSIYFVGQSFSVNNDLPSTNTVPPDFWTMKLFECHSARSEYSRDACIGDTLTIGKQSYFAGKEIGVDTFFKATSNGCDSIVQVQVRFHPATSGQIVDTLCNDVTVTINNVLFDKNNTTKTFSLTNHLGCDSTLQVDLIFLPEILVTDTLITKDDGTGTGCIKVTVEGGCEPYRYEWSNGAQTPEVCSLAKGTYTLTLKDCMDCSRDFSFVVGTTVANEDLNTDVPVISYLQDRIIIKAGVAAISRASIYTVSGQLIRRVEPENVELTVEKSSLPKGSLVMDLVLENGRRFQFLIVN